jgi:Protein of unknown function (DUF5132)
MSDGIDGAASDDAEPVHSSNGSAWSSNDFKTKAATVGVVVIGAALIETALIPGIVIGLAAAVAPKYMPQMGQPMFRSAVRGAYKFGRKAREAAAEATEQVQDIVAEVHAENTEAPEAKPHA